jgi:hypothetical protein
MLADAKAARFAKLEEGRMVDGKRPFLIAALLSLALFLSWWWFRERKMA